MKRFLIINPFGIGDILFTTPVIRAIKESLPDSFIAYWCNARVKEILEDNPRVDKLFGLSRGDIKKIYRDSFFSGMYASVGLWQSIRKANFDTAIDFSLDYRYALTASLAGIKKRIGFDYKNRGRFLTDAITIAGYKDKHMVEHNLDLLAFIGLTASFKNLEIFVLQKIEEISIRFLRKQGVTHDDALIGLVPGGGASWGGDAGLKRWPVENFAKLAQELLQKKGVKIVILGDESERPLADIIIGMLKDKAIDLVGKTNLRELAGIISHLKVLDQ